MTIKLKAVVVNDPTNGRGRFLRQHAKSFELRKEEQKGSRGVECTVICPFMSGGSWQRNSGWAAYSNDDVIKSMTSLLLI